jgi:undecaprenyl-diphosphatase
VTALQAVLWGVLQGLTEFLPVSSSGHLVLVPWLVGATVPGLGYDVAVHLGTLLAVLVVLRRDIGALLVALWRIVRRRRIEGPTQRLVVWLVLATIPAAVLGALYGDAVEAMLGRPAIIAGLLIVTGVLLLVGEWAARQNRRLDGLRWPDALLIGLAQAVALAPGISRSGATMSAGLWRGLERAEAARFSFLLSVPIILGAAASRLLGSSAGVGASHASLFALGFAAAALSGGAALWFLLRHVRLRSLRPFAFYCFAMALLCLAVSLLRR